MSTLVVTIVALGAIGWFAYLVGSGSRRDRRDPVPANLSASQTDDELETKRLDRALVGAVVTAGFLTLAMPIYYLGELDRQEGFVVEFHEASLERGHEVWLEIGCGDCHGAAMGGGVAAYLEERSQINVAGWTAPALDDLFYRYDRDESEFWIVYGRANSPMPAWGLEGGGPLNSQQVDDLLNYIEDHQVSQTEALLRVEGSLSGARTRREGAAEVVSSQIMEQEELIETIRTSGPTSAALAEIAERAGDLLAGAGEGIDTDGDGLSDVTEFGLTTVFAEAAAAGYLSAAPTLDPRNAETLIGIGDFASARGSVSDLESAATSLTITFQNQEVLAEQAEFGHQFLQDAADRSRWEVDVSAVADATFEGNLESAERAVNLYNAYCARCHTAGYSAGPAFQQIQASGALGPSLRGGRALTQFLTAEDMYAFISTGSESGVGYGVNGVGSGRMPGFGLVLSEEDLNLIVDYLRGTTLDGVEYLEETG
ncbi:MAG: cytochrome c [bacterium]|nr:cytochrome c [bacterium]MCY3653375.1 cytochrome c [bacterium]